MTVIKSDDARHEEIALKVEHCAGCQNIHLRAGGLLLTLTQSEFAVFAESVAQCYWQLEVWRSGHQLITAAAGRTTHNSSA
jgi:hypothetical protein